ncbi:MAG TPA: aminotransferase class IV, partial [Kofleriaceae bacterium]|nr:aminotransferase class IV [Kofleriaceae bacterium]
VFIVRDGTLLTPPLTAALPGITRATVLALAEELQIPARETYFTRDEGYVADEAFFTGTAAEITPIIEIDGRKIGSGQRGPITARLSDLYNDIVRGRSKTHRDWLTIIA